MADFWSNRYWNLRYFAERFFGAAGQAVDGQSGSAQGQALVSGLLVGAGWLSAAVTAQASSTGALGAASDGNLSGEAIGQATVIGDLKSRVQYGGGRSDPLPSLREQPRWGPNRQPISGRAQGASLASGALQGVASGVGQTAGAASASAALAGIAPLNARAATASASLAHCAGGVGAFGSSAGATKTTGRLIGVVSISNGKGESFSLELDELAALFDLAA